MTTGFVFLRSAEQGSASAIHETVQELAEIVALGLDVEPPVCTTSEQLQDFLRLHGVHGDVQTSFSECGDDELVQMLKHAMAVGDAFGALVLEAEIALRDLGSDRPENRLPAVLLPA